MLTNNFKIGQCYRVKYCSEANLGYWVREKINKTLLTNVTIVIFFSLIFVV